MWLNLDSCLNISLKLYLLLHAQVAVLIPDSNIFLKLNAKGAKGIEASVKRAAKTCNLFSNIAAKRLVEKPSFTTLVHTC